MGAAKTQSREWDRFAMALARHAHTRDRDSASGIYYLPEISSIVVFSNHTHARDPNREFAALQTFCSERSWRVMAYRSYGGSRVMIIRAPRAAVAAVWAWWDELTDASAEGRPPLRLVKGRS